MVFFASLRDGKITVLGREAKIKISTIYFLIQAARYAQSLRGVWFDLSDEEMDLLTKALKYHSDGYTEAEITVQVCWDADRLDLGRVGIKPAPHRLCTASAKSVDVLEAAYERSVEGGR
jgi:uncharacterized protein